MDSRSLCEMRRSVAVSVVPPLVGLYPYRAGTVKPSAKARATRRAHADAMRQLRPVVLERYGYECVARGLLDGECHGRLHVHHRYIAVRVDTEANLVPLCWGHHEGRNGVHGARMMARAYDLGLLIREGSGPPSEPWRRVDTLPPLDWWGDEA